MLKQISILVVIVLVVSGSAMAYFVDDFTVDSTASTGPSAGTFRL